MNTIRELFDILEENQIIRTQQMFADMVGMSRPVISQLLSGKRQLTDKHIRKISRAFPFVNQNWLRTGEGEFGDIERVTAFSNASMEQKDKYWEEIKRWASMYEKKALEVNHLYNKLAEYSKALAEKEKELLELKYKVDKTFKSSSSIDKNDEIGTLVHSE